MSRLACSPWSSLAGYLFVVTFCYFHAPSDKLLDAPDELYDARKERLFAPGAPQ